MNPCCNILYARSRFLTYIYNLHAYITKMGHHRQKRHVWQLQSSGRRTTVVTTVTHFPLNTVHLSVCPSNLIYVCSLLTQQFLNSRAICAHMSVFPLCLSSQLTQRTLPSNLKLHFSWKYVLFFTCAKWYVCTITPVVLCVSMNRETVSCEYFSAPRAPQEILNYIWVSLKVETCYLRLCARTNHSCLQLTAGGQECRVHRAWPPAVKVGSDPAKAAADAKWTITAWLYLTWTEGRRSNSLTHLKGRNCGFYVLPMTLLRGVQACFVCEGVCLSV